MPAELFATLISLALASGINLYATVLVVGLAVRFGWVQNIPAGLEVLGSWPVIAVAGAFYMVEFLADKIQFVDNAWDAVHTLIRPLGAAFLGTEMLHDATPETQFIAALVAGGVALTSHSGKAGGRAALNVASPAENISNIVVSLAEDFGVAVLVLLALSYPFAAAGIAAIILILILAIAPRLFRWLRFILLAIIARLRALIRVQSVPDSLPPVHAGLLPPYEPILVVHCTAQGIKGAHSRIGYLSLFDRDLYFTYKRWFKIRAWQLKPDQIVSVGLRHRLLVDVLEVRYCDTSQRERAARFLCFKDRTALIKQFSARLNP
ncbi:MAG: hypothetical protein KatS3mg057_0608 [Herpetosiphonaceae bacterium]|nr:MAG: hypothetical protein KatS3mg057_0608 [Herpetosiphonaceae bacterium]